MAISSTRPVVEIELPDLRGSWGVKNAERKTRFVPDELPVDCLRLISEFNPTSDPETRLAMRSVSKAWREASSGTLEVLWERLKAAPARGPVPLRELMIKIESSTPSCGVRTYATRFKLLHKEFEKRGLPAVGPGARIEVTTEEFTALQKHVADISLQKCWPSIVEALELVTSFPPSRHLSADEIRTYLKNPANASKIDLVRSLYLNHLGLKSLPVELHHFKNLVILRAEHNDLREFTLPVKISGPIDLIEVSKLRAIDLFDNKLTAIPDLGLLSAEATVHLYNNEISFFDRTTGISCNLTLDSNPAFTLLFRDLYEFNSQHYTLVEERMEQLWDIDGNPVMSRREVPRKPLEVLGELRSYVATSPLGGLIHKVCFEGISDEALASDILALSKADRDAIYYGVWKLALWSYWKDGNWGAPDLPDGSPTYGEDHAFEDFDRLKVALRYAILHKLETLPIETQHRLFGRVYEEFGSPETTNTEWGRRHATKNIMLLADLVSET